MRKWILALLCLPTLVTAAPLTLQPDMSDNGVHQAMQGDAANRVGTGSDADNSDADDGWGAASTPFGSPDQGNINRFAEQDPWEGFNRKIFSFNRFADRWVMKPVAKGYQWVTPQWLDDTVTRVFENLHDLSSGINSVLQWRWGNAGNNFGRFAVNSTLGLGGLFDVASDLDLEKHSTSLDMTLARWGVHAGPYMVLPVLGPSSVRDTSSLYPSAYLWAPTYIQDTRTRLGVVLLYGIDKRADLLNLEKNIVGDRYSFIRDAYLQIHVFNTQNGNGGGPPPLPDEDLPDDSDAGW